MSLSLRLRVAALALVFCGLASPARAQNDDAKQPAPYNAIIDNIDLLVEKYTHFLVRKYDLTEEQDEYTRHLLRERTYEFLDRHEEEVRRLVGRMFEVRTGGEMTPEQLIEWGLHAKPIYEHAKKLIVEGNDEWRKILTTDQREIHDDDLKLMYQSFETTEDQLERIASGELTVEDFRSPQRRHRPSRAKTTNVPPAPEGPPLAKEAPPDVRTTPLAPRPRTGKVEPRRSDRTSGETTRLAPPERSASPPRVESRRRSSKPESEPREARPGRSRVKRLPGQAKSKGFEGEWEKYVREFIEKYKLNDEQAQKANAVLEDCKSQANRYLRGRKAEIEQLDKRIEELKKSKDKNKAKTKTKALSNLNSRRTKLTEPIGRIFEQQLKPRLERLPTRAQRRAAETAAKKPATKKAPAKKPPAKPETKKGSDRAEE